MRGTLCRGEDAEPWFRQAMALAAGQGALFWELRAATSLARLLADRGERAAAWQLLAPVHARFPSDANTVDMRAAEALLLALRSQR